MKKTHTYLPLALIITFSLLAGCNTPTDSNSAVQEKQKETATLDNDTSEATHIDVPLEDELSQASSEAVQESDDSIYQSTQVGFTLEGFPYRGNLEAPITIEEYSDYLCPFCGRHFNQTLPSLIQQYVVEGKVQYVFRDMPLVSLHPNAPVGHKAARCVGEQSASGYWQMHDELFSTQNQWGSVPDSVAFVTELAKNTGVDMNAFETCMASTDVETQIDESVAAGAELGFNGTPSFRFTVNETGKSYTLIGAYPLGTFIEWIDALLAGEEPPQAQEEQADTEPSELPFWANERGLAPDPDRPGYTMAGDQFKGNPESPVVVVEFSDFQCPACQQHALEIQPEIDKALVDNGEIMWVFKHLPLQEHPQSLIASVAAECAADQDEFWEMHHLLFEKQAAWITENPEPVLVDLARSLGLDIEKFSTCLDSRKPLERVFHDFYDGQGVVRSTPTFIIFSDGRGRMLQGSRDAEQFVKIIQSVIDQASETP